jgi:hypothetical protein
MSAASTEWRRTTRNLLVVGDYAAAAGPEARQRVAGVVEMLVTDFQRIAGEQGAGLCIVTGLDSQAETDTAMLANRLRLELHVVAPHVPQAVASGEVDAQRVAVLAANPQRQAVSGARQAAVEEAMLGFADALVVVWDRSLPSASEARPTNLLTEALRRHLPIVWVDSRPERAGIVRILDTRLLDDITLATLGTSGQQLGRVADQFVEMANDFHVGLAGLLSFYWDMTTIRELVDKLKGRHGDPGSTTVFTGCMHRLFFSAFGAWKARLPGALAADRGPPRFVAASALPSHTWEWFDQLDRAATRAAHRHRDGIVGLNVCASLAVLVGVLGFVFQDWSRPFGAFEAVLLVGAFWIFSSRGIRSRGHDAWLLFRQAAEAFRMNALLHPMLASLPALFRAVWTFDPQGPRKIKIDKPYHWLVIQLFRDAGVPGRFAGHCVQAHHVELLGALAALIKDQGEFHRSVYERYETTDTRIEFLLKFFLGLALLAAAVHALGVEQGQAAMRSLTSEDHQRWPLILTAFLPAAAAALHGIRAKIEFHRLARTSRRLAERLQALNGTLALLQYDNDPMALRAVAIDAATIMFTEHASWAELAADQYLEAV